jgi:hypothetical protein
MNVTVLVVKCKAKKCGETIRIEEPLASGETLYLQCRVGHRNRYGESDVEPRTIELKKK